MKCSQARTWYLAVKVYSDLPGSVEKHLARCAKCRLEWNRLQQLDTRVRELPLPPANEAKQRLRQRVRPTANPEPAPPVLTPRTPTPSHWRLWSVALAASVALLLLGWFLGRMVAPHLRPDPTDPQNRIAHHPTTTELEVRLVGHNVKLARELPLDERIRVLDSMAGDLREDTLRRAERNHLDHVPLLVALHGRLVARGITPIVHQLGDAERTEWIAHLDGDFDRLTARTKILSRKLPPVASEMLAPLAESARQGKAGLRNAPEPIPAPAWTEEPTTPLLDALVTQGIRLARAQSSLERAVICAELAPRLASHLAALGSDEDHADQLGGYIDTLLDEGVAVNWSDAERNDPDQAKKQADRVKGRSKKAIDILKRNLEKAPPAARKGLQRALEVTSKNPGRGKPDKPKGRGPPWLRDKGSKPGRGRGQPPGLQKQRNPKPNKPQTF